MGCEADELSPSLAAMSFGAAAAVAKEQATTKPVEMGTVGESSVETPSGSHTFRDVGGA